MIARGFRLESLGAWLLSRISVGPRTLPLLRSALRLAARGGSGNADVAQVDAAVSVRTFRPTTRQRRTPALLWIHGGGLVAGNAAMDDRICRRIADQLGIVVASVEYRLAPEHPFPVPLQDSYSALRWLASQSDVDETRIAIGGASAGGGLAAALAILARDRGEFRLAFQLLVYPMLDDRTVARTDIDEPALRVWNQTSNRFGWRSYLGSVQSVPSLAAPARHDDLAGLPPAWIGVGTNDLFHDEDVTYASRLQQAGVSCVLRVVPDAYHAFDYVEARSHRAQAFRQEQLAVLDAALHRPF